jgi:PadR family transcriptional regulator PadR
MPERTTKTLVRLLEVLMSDPTKEWYGLELIDGARLSSGTLYPLLQRLVADGWLERTGERPSEIGGTARRMYRLTAVGSDGAARLMHRSRPKPRPVARRPQLGTLAT